MASKNDDVTFYGKCTPGAAIQYFGGLVPGLGADVVAHYNVVKAPACNSNGTWTLKISEKV